MATWLAAYRFGMPLEVNGLASFQWHAHEMIFGFALAVVAGFLLTATQNWTGVETLNGKNLAGLFSIWLAARLFLLSGTTLLPHAAIADISFMLILTVAIAQPVYQVRQIRQIPILLILCLLTAATIAFYLAAISGDQQKVSASLYAGLYLVLGLILFMGRRVIPFFTQRGVGYEVEIDTPRWNDLATWLLFPAFLVAEVYFHGSKAGAFIAASLFILNALRLYNWYTRGIWRKPLLWSLHLAYLMIIAGFALRALQAVISLSPFIAIHAFAVGGIGLVTISMMPRVSLGHTGRSIHDAPAIAYFFIGAMALAAVFRVFAPWLDPSRYALWIFLSGLLWIVAFFLFAVSIGPMLLRKRADA